MTMVEAIFGPWLERGYGPDDYERHITRWLNWKKNPGTQEERERLEDKIRRHREIMQKMTTESARVAFNEKHESEPALYVPRTDEVHVLEGDMLRALDLIFQTVYSGTNRLAFCLNSEKGKDLYCEYVNKVTEYLKRYADRATKGKEKKDFTEREQRLSRASMLTDLYMRQLWDEDDLELPFPTDSMLERLWECLADYDEAFREVRNISGLTGETSVSAFVLSALSRRGMMWLGATVL
jgi:hypothetical protein